VTGIFKKLEKVGDLCNFDGLEVIPGVLFNRKGRQEDAENAKNRNFEKLARLKSLWLFSAYLASSLRPLRLM
jgi:hypothetical protein